MANFPGSTYTLPYADPPFITMIGNDEGGCKLGDSLSDFKIIGDTEIAALALLKHAMSIAKILGNTWSSFSVGLIDFQFDGEITASRKFNVKAADPKVDKVIDSINRLVKLKTFL